MSNTQFKETDENNPNAIELFTQIWAELEAKFGADGLCFPKAIFWLNGAPGAGKGTQTKVFCEEFGIENSPIVMSDLLKTPEMEAIKATGQLIDNATVIGLLFRTLIKPEYRAGVMVDGFPRTAGQVACLKLLAKKLDELHAGTPEKFAPANFTMLMLYVTEDESVARQLQRGREMQAAGKPVRETDLDPEKTHHRYQIFQTTTLEPLQSLKGTFPYIQINSLGSIAETAAEIRRKLRAGDASGT